VIPEPAKPVKTLADAEEGAILNAVTAAAVVPVNTDAPSNAALVLLAVKNTAALVGVALKAVNAVLAVANGAAAASEPDEMPVIAPAVLVEAAFAP
jgi:hypothetical protein